MKRVFASTCAADASQRGSSTRDSYEPGRDAQLSSPQEACLDEIEAMSETRDEQGLRFKRG